MSHPPHEITVGKGKRWVNNPSGVNNPTVPSGAVHPSSFPDEGEAHGNTVLWMLSPCSPQRSALLVLWGSDPMGRHWSSSVTHSLAPGHHQSEEVQGGAACCPNHETLELEGLQRA